MKALCLYSSQDVHLVLWRMRFYEHGRLAVPVKRAGWVRRKWAILKGRWAR